MNTLSVATLIAIVVIIGIIRMVIYRRNRNSKPTVNEVKTSMLNKAATANNGKNTTGKQHRVQKVSLDAPTIKILCERPVNMSFKAYREHLIYQKAWIKNRLRGRVISTTAGSVNGKANK